jgi:hypothetical protein
MMCFGLRKWPDRVRALLQVKTTTNKPTFWILALKTIFSMEIEMMKRKIMAVVLIALFAAGCGKGDWKDSAVAKDDGIVVRLEQQMKDGQVVDQNYQHPIEIDPFTMSWLLDDLRYIPKSTLIGGSGETPVFKQYEIDRLAPALSEALQMADSSRRVHFTSYNTSKELLFEKPAKTEGVMFVDSAGTLHIAFSWINVLLDIDGKPQSPRASHKFDVLTLKDTEAKIVAAKPYMSTYRLEQGKTASMRLAINLDHLRAMVSRQVQQQTGYQYSQPAGAYGKDYQPVKKASTTHEMQTPQASEPAMKSPESRHPEQRVQAAPAPLPQDLETRREQVRIHLKYLKEIYEEGLITEDEYDQQRKKTLEALQ